MTQGVVLKGIGVSPGIAVGHALVLEREAVAVFRMVLPAEAVEGEVARLARALETSRAQLRAIKERLDRDVGFPHAYIFEAHLLMLEDPLLSGRAVETIRRERVNAEHALRTVGDWLHASFEALSDAYLKERSTDVDDVLGRILLNLAGSEDAPSLARLPGSYVLVADELSPSEAASLDWERVLAVVTDGGSPTHHTSILARSFGIPAVVRVGDASARIPVGALVAVDGSRGEVMIDPSGVALAGFRETQEQNRIEDRRLQQTRELPCVTLDGHRVWLLANAEFPGEADTAVEYGAEGIGLFRSEYMLGRSRRWPTETQQVEIYRRLQERLRPHPVTVRTWDVSADEMVPGGPTRTNPALGERALRLIRRDPTPFLIQARALLQAAVDGPLRILFPFVGGPSDVALIRELLADARRSLERDGLPCAPNVPIGLTIELPSAAATADLLAAEVDFFSIGTNDLVQYLLGVDRVDPRVAALYEPLHPAVLRTIEGVARAAEAAGIPVSVCGEMAAEPSHAVLLIGLGIPELSMSPSAIPRVKALLRAVSLREARALAVEAMGLPTAPLIEAMLRRGLKEARAAAQPA